MKKRVIILLLDSLGIGASLDAINYGDAGADTLGHIVAKFSETQAIGLAIPTLIRYGIAHAALASTGKRWPNVDYQQLPSGYFGYGVSQSNGKDTLSGHWELAGIPVNFSWGYFNSNTSSFPDKLIKDLITAGNLPGILGNCHASGTSIIEQLGKEHIETGKPIIYTSADSVLQIAAHEDTFGLERLYSLCQIARKLADQYRIARVIARPFVGKPGQFLRTANRVDWATPPPEPTLLDKICGQGGQVIGIGKISDIFAHQGITVSLKGKNNDELFSATSNALQNYPQDKTLIFTNFVDFDTHYGHRRDWLNYGRALEQFDLALANFILELNEGDLVLITADHGCDPCAKGSEHTREHVPILMFGKNKSMQFIGRRDTLADMGQSIASYLGLAPLFYGNSFL